MSEAKWELKIKPLDEAEVHFPEKNFLISKLVCLKSISVSKLSMEIGVYMNDITSILWSANIQQGIMAWWPPTSSMSTWVFAPGVTTAQRSWSGHTWVDHFKTHHPEITGDDYCGPPSDLAGVKLEEIDTSEIQ